METGRTVEAIGLQNSLCGQLWRLSYSVGVFNAVEIYLYKQLK